MDFSLSNLISSPFSTLPRTAKLLYKSFFPPKLLSNLPNQKINRIRCLLFSFFLFVKITSIPRLEHSLHQTVSQCFNLLFCFDSYRSFLSTFLPLHMSKYLDIITAFQPCRSKLITQVNMTPFVRIFDKYWIQDQIF